MTSKSVRVVLLGPGLVGRAVCNLLKSSRAIHAQVRVVCAIILIFSPLRADLRVDVRAEGLRDTYSQSILFFEPFP
eukprot:1365309-Amorphochlora_amoeboformis.AAC.1